MSINNSSDTRMATAANGFHDPSRENDARNAAYTIYTQSDNYLPSVNTGATTGSSEGQELNAQQQRIRKELKFSRMRRMFCLLALFDFLLMTILWFIYVNLTAISVSIRKRLICEVQEYRLQTSLFDFVVLALFRSVILLSLYGLLHGKHWWTVALTTTLSCVFLISKVFLYDFGYKDHDKNPCVPGYTQAHPVDFIIAIVSFIIPWVETWVLDYQVLPREKKLQEALAHQVYQDNSISERTPLLPGNLFAPNSDPIRFYSPQGSQTSDIESESDYSESVRSHASDFQSLPNSQRGSSVNLAASIQEQEYLQKAKESLRILDRILAKQEGWQEMAKKDEHNAAITTCKMEGVKGKVYKLETELPAPPEQAVILLWHNVDDSPSWNPTILESEVLQQIDDHTDIIYNVSSGGPGNIVSGRDFVAVRNYWHRGDGHVCSSMSVEHPRKPPGNKYVRGFNGPTGWVAQQVEGNSSITKFTWILNTDLNFKVWTPQAIIDQALSHVLMDICINLQRKLAEQTRAVDMRPSAGMTQPEFEDVQEGEAILGSFVDIEEQTASLDSFGSV